EAVGMPGVHAVLTHSDVPGAKTYGLEFPDQPVLAIDRVRYFGEPVAIVAAEHPEQARRAAERIRVAYEPLEPVVDPEQATEREPIHEGRPTAGHGFRDDERANVVRSIVINHGDPDAEADVTVSGVYELGIQDQAFLGPESGLAIPDAEGGVDVYVATQWLHIDRDQVAPCLGLEPKQVRIHLAGVGGAFGGREDLSMQIHSALLALHTNRPVKMVYNREESFTGHVHRHPARLWAEHRATRDGQLVNPRMRILLDGRAHARRHAVHESGDHRRAARRGGHQALRRAGRAGAGGVTARGDPAARRRRQHNPRRRGQARGGIRGRLQEHLLLRRLRRLLRG